MRKGVAAVALAFAAGCGSTVQSIGTSGVDNATAGLAAPAAGASSGADGLSVPGGTSATSSGALGTSGATTVGNAPGVTGPDHTTSTAGTSTEPSSASAGLPTTGRGYDAQSLYLGFPTNTDVSDAAPKGIGATNFGDQRGIIEAVIKDVNRHGGVLGRTVVPVFHDIKTSELETDPNTAAQSTCTALTQDHHVVGIVNIVAAIDLATFYSCVAKHDTPLISAGFIPVDDKSFATYAPYLYKLTASSFTHLAPVWIARLTAMGYFHGWDANNGRPASDRAKIGLLYPDVQPQVRDFADIRARLRNAGYDVAKDYAYDASSLDAESASMGNAVLQMRNADVTHILSSESDVLLFMEAADGQHYRPRYGLTSYHAPAVQLQGTVPSSQLVGSMGAGWLPVTDVDAAHNPGAVGPGEASCRRVMHGAGEDISAPGAAIVALAICDGVRLIAGSVNMSGDPSSGGLNAGLAELSGSFESALTWRAGLSASRYDLPGVVRDFMYKNGAYAYTSKVAHRV